VPERNSHCRAALRFLHAAGGRREIGNRLTQTNNLKPFMRAATRSGTLTHVNTHESYYLEEIVNRLGIFLCLLLISAPVFADQVNLKNGDRLTGTIVKSDTKELVIKTEYAGDITVKFDQISTIASTGDLDVSAAGGKMLVGPVTTENDKLAVKTRDSGTVEVAKSDIVTVRSPAEQAAYEKTLHPGWLDAWNGGLNLGFALTRGNSETKNLSFAFNADRKGLHDKTILYATDIYASNDAPGAIPSLTASAIGGGARYDHDFSTRTFGFVNGDFFHDQLQALDLRSIIGGGVGFHAIKNASLTLDLLGGLNYTHENYSVALNPAFPLVMSRSVAGLTVGDDLTYKLGKTTDITQNLYFYPDLSNTGEYRMTFNFGTVTKINKWLGWQNSLADIYVSDPPFGKKKNDLLLSTGLNISFSH
jgi:putative salt-induced outer membrane protein YdiY